jgi:hypothetical protein
MATSWLSISQHSMACNTVIARQRPMMDTTAIVVVTVMMVR